MIENKKRNKIIPILTITHKISETNSSLPVKYLTRGKV